VSKAQTSTLAFTADVAGPEDDDVAVGLVITAGLEAVALGTLAGALLSFDVQPVLTKNRPKIRIPKIIE
jgi:hypothetical protein